MSFLTNIDNFYKREFNTLKHNYSSINLRELNSNLVVNTDTDRLLEYDTKGNVINEIVIKRNGEFLSITDSYGKKVLLNLFDLIKDKPVEKKKKFKFF